MIFIILTILKPALLGGSDLLRGLKNGGHDSLVIDPENYLSSEVKVSVEKDMLKLPFERTYLIALESKALAGLNKEEAGLQIERFLGEFVSSLTAEKKLSSSYLIIVLSIKDKIAKYKIADKSQNTFDESYLREALTRLENSLVEGKNANDALVNLFKGLLELLVRQQSENGLFQSDHKILHVASRLLSHSILLGSNNNLGIPNSDSRFDNGFNSNVHMRQMMGPTDNYFQQPSSMNFGDFPSHNLNRPDANHMFANDQRQTRDYISAHQRPLPSTSLYFTGSQVPHNFNRPNDVTDFRQFQPKPVKSSVNSILLDPFVIILISVSILVVIIALINYFTYSASGTYVDRENHSPDSFEVFSTPLGLGNNNFGGSATIHYNNHHINAPHVNYPNQINQVDQTTLVVIQDANPNPKINYSPHHQDQVIVVEQGNTTTVIDNNYSPYSNGLTYGQQNNTYAINTNQNVAIGMYNPTLVAGNYGQPSTNIFINGTNDVIIETDGTCAVNEVECYAVEEDDDYKSGSLSGTWD